MHRDPTKRMMEIIATAIAEFSNRQSLITVTSAELSDTKKMFHIGVSVLPETQEEAVMEFLKRNQNTIRIAMRDQIRINPMPYLKFHIDLGEKNRRRIEELSSGIE